MAYGQAGPDANPLLSSTFAVEIDGIEVMAFEKATIDGSEWSTMNARPGVDPLYTKTAHGTKKAHVITIEKNAREGGLGDVAAFLNWHELGSSMKKTGAMIQNDRDGNEIGRITFYAAWLKKITFPQWDAEEEAGPTTYTFEIEAGRLEHGLG